MMQFQLQQQIRSIVVTDGKLSAIKHLMNSQGLRLMPAKEQVEAIMRGTPDEPPRPPRLRCSRSGKPIWPLLTIGALLLASVSAISGAVYIGSSHQQLANNGERVRATVVGLERVGARCRAPIMEYEVNGDTNTYVSSISSSPPAYDVGDAVTIFVDEKDSQRVMVDDFAHRWMLPMVFGIIGISLLLPIGIVFFLFCSGE